ncbi:hypothetical protein [Cohaesibacter gelatinilyticus]|uniref:Uncharacterized protein n=1 Tax=Cohaesibacter gelatinilyticus TaxID=372072 RepID=A0A285PF59_9HYPH|nr:hypothetical protein [Cohaesibacter gelatinilyticus]SNZ20078.1 hypothetical protein SAMN06265368_3177 [Cohaesibacter gelatinilyticus]
MISLTLLCSPLAAEDQAVVLSDDEITKVMQETGFLIQNDHDALFVFEPNGADAFDVTARMLGAEGGKCESFTHPNRGFEATRCIVDGHALDTAFFGALVAGGVTFGDLMEELGLSISAEPSPVDQNVEVTPILFPWNPELNSEFIANKAAIARACYLWEGDRGTQLPPLKRADCGNAKDDAAVVEAKLDGEARILAARFEAEAAKTEAKAEAEAALAEAMRKNEFIRELLTIAEQ